jgi:hypothetical protein
VTQSILGQSQTQLRLQVAFSSPPRQYFSKMQLLLLRQLQFFLLQLKFHLTLMDIFVHSQVQKVLVCALLQLTTQTTTQSDGLGALTLDLLTKQEPQLHFQALALHSQATQLLT